ncbi:hypothetical protein M0R45_022044 [Rubus argutus]|uniref:Prolyl endopeptidase n=1 Tax=Rubus argutus TaxID=59490 RepID=A0AAW1XG31_RUBAR
MPTLSWLTLTTCNKTLVSEMTSRMPTKISTPPERWGPWLYYQYIPEGKEYPDLRSGCIIPKLQINGVVSLAWAQDGRTLFYTLSDENQRPYRVLCSQLESDDMENITVFTESDSSFCVDITSTKDGKFITVNSNSRTSSEEGILLVYLIDSAKPLHGLQKVWKRVSGYYLARCCLEDLLLCNWQNIILPSEDSSVQDMDMFDGHLVLFVNKKSLSIVCSIDLPMAIDRKHQVKIEDLNPWFFPLPLYSCSVAPGSNHDFKNSAYRVVVSSPVMPDVVVDYDMSTRRFSVVQQEEVRGFCDTCPPASEQDMNQTLGKQYEKDENVHTSESQRWKDFSAEYCWSVTWTFTRIWSIWGGLDKSWCSDRLSLLDRGWVVAFADVRGSGGDSSWHKAGSRFNKLNSIYDFVSCGNYLIKEGYVHRDQLGAIGHSAGGLLVGATINMYPDLFSAAILKVPFLDVCNTLMDPSLPLTILDYEEFGNPQIQSQFEHILSYSPYDNICQGSCYPSMLVTASFHDSRVISSYAFLHPNYVHLNMCWVGLWEAAKWVAKVRDVTCPHCSSSVILKTNMGAGGHFGEGGRYAQSEETAYDYAFLLKAMGMLKNEE